MKPRISMCTTAIAFAAFLAGSAFAPASAQVQYGPVIDGTKGQADRGLIEQPQSKATSDTETYHSTPEPLADGVSDIGLLTCRTKLASNTDRLGQLDLDCTFNRRGSDTKADVTTEAFRGKMVGTSERVGTGGDDTLIFEVFSTKSDAAVDRLAGDYDRSSSRAYEIRDPKFPYLFGGAQDTVVLKPRGQAADAMNASSNLSLTRVIDFKKGERRG